MPKYHNKPVVYDGIKYNITIKNKIKIMEFKKKIIIWEDNNEPPKDYIGVKSDNKAYEYNHTEKCGKESTTISIISNNAK